MDTTATMWVVQVLRQWKSLQVMGLPLHNEQLPGCIGFLPVFSTLEEAKQWRDEEHPSAGIVAIQPGTSET